MAAMKTSPALLLTAAAAAIVVVIESAPVLARGGPPSIMDSPGYQRRLQESRQQLSEPEVRPAPTHRKKRRHP
jgi:hypothetical protein